MEDKHKDKLLRKYKKYINKSKIITLDIKDNYEYMDEELVKILKLKVKRYLSTYF